MSFKFNEVSVFINTLYEETDDSITVKFDTNELHFGRHFIKECVNDGKYLKSIPEVDLYFSYESACKLRDFLNYALPEDEN